MSIPTVQITVVDNGASAALVLPQSNVQVVLGVAVGGPANVPVSTTNPATLANVFTAGPLVEAAGLVCQAGGTVIAMRVATVTHGTVTAVTPTVPGTSTASVSVTLDGTNGAYDDYYVRVKCVTSGAIGTAGIQYQLSLDAGRNYGPILALGVGTSHTIVNTGITVTFGTSTQTMIAGDYWSFSTTAPAWNDGGVATALSALAASQYAIQGWGSMHLVGVSAKSDIDNIEGNLDALTSQYIYTRCLTTARDAVPPAPWCGAGSTETEVAWITALTSNFGGATDKRICVGAGYYNMPSPFPNTECGTPAYRRPLTWADAVRRTLVPTQRRGGRVKDGSLTNIVTDPASDPFDGFIYHDERNLQGLDAARFMSAITWPKQLGFFICHENLMSPPGSQYTELVFGNVIDVACDIGYATGVNEISDDLRLTDAGTLYPTDALQLQSTLNAALSQGMTNVSMVSSAAATVSQSANVRATNTIQITISVNRRGYVDDITETIQLAAG